MAEADDDPGGEGTRVDPHLALLQIDPADLPAQHAEAAADPPDRVDDVARGDGGPRDLGEHGLEDEVVLVRDDHGLLGPQPGALQFLREALPAGDPGETAAEDGDFEIETGGDDGGGGGGHGKARSRPINPAFPSRRVN